MVLLFVFMSMGTLIMGNLLRSFVEDPSNLFEDRVWVWNRYGTAYRAMYTLYEVLWREDIWGSDFKQLPSKWGFSLGTGLPCGAFR